MKPPDRVLETLRLASQTAPAGPLLIGYSGGLDSTVLLHALNTFPNLRAIGLRAVHIDHGLHPDSEKWARHCTEFAAALQVPLSVVRVGVDRGNGEGLESAARRARYGAFATVMQPGHLLTLAQHLDDQTETVLLKLLRGAGPEGLGAMRVLRAFSQGYLWRPLLHVSRSALQAYAQAHDLRWIEDPSNADIGFDRNYLRSEVLPNIRKRWPQMSTALGHAIAWNQAAFEFIESHTQAALAEVRATKPGALRWHDWLHLPAALRGPVLQSWLRELGLPSPAHFHVQELERQLLAARDREPCVRWPGAELRRYREFVYATPPLVPIADDWERRWDGTPLHLPGGCGTLLLEPQAKHSPATPASAQNVKLWVRFRRGGERLKLVGGLHMRDLRTLFQEAGIPPWQRKRIPLLFTDGEATEFSPTAGLLAVGDLWLSEGGIQWLENHGMQLRWDRDPKIGN